MHVNEFNFYPSLIDERKYINVLNSFNDDEFRGTTCFMNGKIPYISTTSSFWKNEKWKFI